MRTQPAEAHSHQRLLGMAATVAVHALVIAGWMLWRQASVEDEGPQVRWIQWVDIRQPVARVVQPLPDPIPPPVIRSTPVAPRVAPPTAVASAAAAPAQAAPAQAAPAQAAPAQAAPAQAAPPAAAAVGEAETGAPKPEAPPFRSADDVMQQARRDIGTISRELKKEFPVRGIRAPIDTAQKRLVRGMELAYELAPPKWYEKAKITELIDPGGQGRRRYRVITPNGPRCWTVDAPHTPNGRDQAKPQGPPKMTNCDPDEEPAKAQDW